MFSGRHDSPHVYAHGGGLDRSGCHCKTATGGYLSQRGGDDDKGCAHQNRCARARLFHVPMDPKAAFPDAEGRLKEHSGWKQKSPLRVEALMKRNMDLVRDILLFIESCERGIDLIKMDTEHSINNRITR